MIPKSFRSAGSLAAARRILFAGMSLLCVVPAFSQKVHDAIRPLPAGAVRLDGFFENDIRNSIDHWNKGVVPYAAMVDFFRNGRSQFALGEMWGKAVRSGCMFYRYTADPELKEILSQTVKDLLSTVRPNGSISCVPPEKQPDGPGGDLWERKYVLLGLDRYYDLVEADPAVLRAMTDQADCIIEQVGEPPKVPITSLGWSPNHIESSTLLEPFMRLYNRTGEKRYLDFARYIVSTGGSEGYDIFRQAYDNVPPHEMGGPYPKAYEMMSMFEGAVEYYRVTGDEYVRRSFMNLYDNIRRNEITIVGNGGGDQPYHPAVMGEGWDHTAVEQTNPDITRMMETCVGVTWMKFCSQILRLTGDPSAVDEIEKYIYNGLLGAMKPSGDGFSYVNLFNGEKVTNYGWGTTFGSLPVTCCNLNGPMGLAYIPFVAVMESDRGPVVNLYNAARAELSTPQGDSLSLRIETDFPLSDRVLVRVDPHAASLFTLSLRIPSWSERTVVKVNGKKVRSVEPGAYLSLERIWKPGDRVELTFDMRCRLLDAPRGSNRAGDSFQALVWGPIVLARDENIDPDYDEPVRVVAGKDRVVRVKRVAPTLASTRLEFEVPTDDGPIRMTDYASVNGWEGAHICTWLPVK
ncbi:beta-L-arabinofuranosidase domain-containing protein [uncultured Alistipes sp.]|uniref:beta-L-arabinofuranosidase domain-containing protein n=1 Tax=uncultured Alistipes sp. TaxID=538949 RepID=UPI00259846AE|nr:beta-L-arabinofuranosidase domain-containing protein [uncultured Alistipes sp.]